MESEQFFDNFQNYFLKTFFVCIIFKHFYCGMSFCFVSSSLIIIEQWTKLVLGKHFPRSTVDQSYCTFLYYTYIQYFSHFLFVNQCFLLHVSKPLSNSTIEICYTSHYLAATKPRQLGKVSSSIGDLSLLNNENYRCFETIILRWLVCYLVKNLNPSPSDCHV